MTAGGDDGEPGGSRAKAGAAGVPQSQPRPDRCVSRLLQYPAPRPHPLNRTAMEQVRACPCEGWGRGPLRRYAAGADRPVRHGRRRPTIHEFFCTADGRKTKRGKRRWPASAELKVERNKRTGPTETDPPQAFPDCFATRREMADRSWAKAATDGNCSICSDHREDFSLLLRRFQFDHRSKNLKDVICHHDHIHTVLKSRVGNKPMGGSVTVWNIIILILGPVVVVNFFVKVIDKSIQQHPTICFSWQEVSQF